MNSRERQFIDTVWDHYQNHGRHDLPWRKSIHPYKILVSEVMLQQTQVDRVQPKYRTFLKHFPTIRALAEAPLGSVLTSWQGLGYNRRAKMLHNCAQTVSSRYRGRFPREYGSLIELPGIGPYTAGAIMAFAYNLPVPLIETNVRTVYLHHFFTDATDVSDAEILKCIEATCDPARPREWYWALMDYGTHLKRTLGNQNSRSKHYTKQSRFEGSDRQIRGAILRTLARSRKKLTRTELHQQLRAFEDLRIDAQLERLLAEGMVTRLRGRYALPD